MNLIVNFGILGVSCLVINHFSDLLGDYISQLGKKLKIPISVRGVLFDGVSSSMPEFMVSLVAAIACIGLFNKPDPTAFADIGIGAIGGSAIFNILIIPFLSVLVVPEEKLSKIKIDRKALIRDMFVYLIAVGLLCFGSYKGTLTPALGWIMTGVYVLYMCYLVRDAKKNPVLEDEEVILTKKRWLILKGLLTLIPIGLAVHFCVSSASIIGMHFGISRIIMSLVVLAAVTSLPDALLSIRSAKNDELDASISNAVGSNSFDILICLGFIIAVAHTKININFDEIKYIFGFLIFSSVMYTISFYFNLKKIYRLGILLAVYVAFIAYLVKII